VQTLANAGPTPVKNYLTVGEDHHIYAAPSDASSPPGLASSLSSPFSHADYDSSDPSLVPALSKAVPVMAGYYTATDRGPVSETAFLHYAPVAQMPAEPARVDGSALFDNRDPLDGLSIALPSPAQVRPDPPPPQQAEPPADATTLPPVIWAVCLQDTGRIRSVFVGDSDVLTPWMLQLFHLCLNICSLASLPAPCPIRPACPTRHTLTRSHRELAASGAEMNPVNAKWQTPLHLACLTRLGLPVVLTLLECGAHAHAVDCEVRCRCVCVPLPGARSIAC
jgi:hypothetical protein